jgi:D-lactate dehydrogenase
LKMLFTSTKPFEKEAFERNKGLGPSVAITYTESQLNSDTAKMVDGFEAVCVFVSDKLSRETLKTLKDHGVRLVALRSAGFNHVDLPAAKELGLRVMRVPQYSPHAVAEFAVGLYLTLNRKIHRAHDRVREGNFSLTGLVGRDVYLQTVGIIGTGNIGKVAAAIFRGFGARVLAYDVAPDRGWAGEHGIEYVTLPVLLEKSDVVSLHAPLNDKTLHLLNAKTLPQMKQGAFLINTSRGGLVETGALIHSLKTKHLGGAALDVYEEEENYFFKDYSDAIIDDDTLARLLTFPNVIISSHQAFLTEEALNEIARVTFKNATDWASKTPSSNDLCAL